MSLTITKDAAARVLHLLFNGDEPAGPEAPVPLPEEDAQPELYSAEPELRPTPRRVPNIGHAVVFVSFAGLVLMVFEIALMVMGLSPASVQGGAIVLTRPKLQIAAMAATYLVTLSAAWLFYPLLWRRKFLDGLQWNWAIARGQASRLIGLGLLLGVMMQIVTYFITPPKTMPIDEFFLTPANAWLITVFGTIVAPVFEEICFRGFLVPAFAIAYDWLSLPRTEEARTRWQSTTALTPLGLMFSAVVSSLCFAMMHAQQVAHLWAALLGLFSISLVLTFVRVKTQSVAASTLVHSAYNSFVFVTVLIATGGYRHLERMTH